MILIAVIVGYLLGIAPFIYLKLQDKQEKTPKEEKGNEVANKNEIPADILDEWLNGTKDKNKINQQDIYQEYVTGQEVTKGE